MSAAADGARRPFDPTERVGEGVTLLEASAGTGKTHTVATLVVHEVAEGRPLEELLVVTFTRKATGTLRERVWQRLAVAARALAPDGTPRAGGPRSGDDEGDDEGDELVAHLRRGSDADRALRHRRLERALADFDAATIATTHGFCQQVLAGLGVAGDAERDLELLDDVGPLVEEAVDDLFIRRFHGGGPVLFDRTTALAIAKVVIDNPEAEIAPVDLSDEEAVLRQRFAKTLRTRIAEQKRTGRLVTYDDLLTRLGASLTDPVRGAMVAERLRRRYSMAIVDEFQDTDTVQWRILQAAFGEPPCRLVLVGDPKQAVYAFRGGDVYAYLQATAGATTRTLDVSWRADQPLLDALDAYFAGAQLGGPAIAHRPLRARPGAEAARLLGPGADAPLTVRILDRRTSGVATTPKTGLAQKDATRALVAADLAGEVRRLLTGDVTLVERDRHGVAGPARPLRPGDLAVLVRSHRDAAAAATHLRDAGVPVVVHGGASVFATPAAQHWLDLLRALELPSALRLRSLALGPFVGWDATRLGCATEADWDQLDDLVHDWAAAARAGSASALLRRIEGATALTARLLGEEGGERQLSDLTHVAELLDAWQGAHPSSLAVLVGWLLEQVAEAARDAESARRRLATDADAVAVHTIHGAKGLEFPVVLLPSMWDGRHPRDDDLPVFHDDDGVRRVGVGGLGPIPDGQRQQAEREQDEEELRLLYVALTRARHHVVLWWATASDGERTAFARILLGRADDGSVAPALAASPDEDEVRDALVALGASAPGCVAVTTVGPVSAAAPSLPSPSVTAGVELELVGAGPAPAGGGPAVLEVGAFGRTIDRSWVRTSYSGLTAAAHLHAHASPSGVGEAVEVDEDVKIDEPVEDDEDGTGPPAGAGPGAGGVGPGAADGGATPLAEVRPLLLADVPGGPRVGTMVHELLEATDFTADDLPAALAEAAAVGGAERLVPGQVPLLVAGLDAALRTPLGPPFGGALRELRPADRLDELGFDLPLAGGDAAVGHVTMDAIADVFASALPADDPFARYHERLGDPLLAASVRGFLTGSIDLVARVGDRHVVIDYKTNRLAPAGEALTIDHYRPAALVGAMVDADYPLQAALYTVALHRYLRWRLPGYDPDRHLGGVAYLFLRGMTGPDAPVDDDGRPAGVAAWLPPSTFVTALSDVLDRGAR